MAESLLTYINEHFFRVGERSSVLSFLYLRVISFLVLSLPLLLSSSRSLRIARGMIIRRGKDNAFISCGIFIFFFNTEMSNYRKRTHIDRLGKRKRKSIIVCILLLIYLSSSLSSNLSLLLVSVYSFSLS